MTTTEHLQRIKARQPMKKKRSKSKRAARSCVPSALSTYQVNCGEPWKAGTPRIDTQMGMCWVVNEKGYVHASFLLTDGRGRGRADDNMAEAKRFFAKYFPEAEKAETAK
jgi:hypothetical protein